MTDRITRSASISTPDGISSTIADYQDVEVVEKIEVTAVKNSVPMVVAAHPIGTPVQSVTITAERYADLTLAVGMGAPITLDAPLELQGAGLVALLGVDTSVLTFINANVTEDNDITILIGRDAGLSGE
jgi:hypothetical protein